MGGFVVPGFPPAAPTNSNRKIPMEKGPRLAKVLPKDLSPVVNLAVWIVMPAILLMLVTVLKTKRSQLHKPEINDLLIGIATLFAAGITTAISFQVHNGLGEHLNALTKTNIRTIEALGYGVELMYIGALAFAKGSTLNALMRVTPQKHHLRYIWIVIGCVSTWIGIFFIGTIFQCSLPFPYVWRINTGVCFHQLPFWYAFGVFDILTELAIISCPLYMMHNLRMPMKKKYKVAFAFSFRLLSVAATIARMVYLKEAINDPDFSFKSYPLAITTEVAMAVCIMGSMTNQVRTFNRTISCGYFSMGYNDEMKENRERAAEKRKQIVDNMKRKEDESAKFFTYANFNFADKGIFLQLIWPKKATTS